MISDYMILYGAWVVGGIALIIFIPKDKIREAHVAFLFKQIITWLIGFIVVELRLIEFPIRLFPHATRNSFTFDYFVYPAICAIFNVHYPEGNNKITKAWYYVSYTSAMTIVEVILQRYTHVIKYIHWAWYWTWITLIITFTLSRLYFRWFFKLKPQAQ